MRIVFFGTSSFAAQILTKLIESHCAVAAIVTRQDKPRGRNLQPSFPPVKEIAQKISPQIPVFQPVKASDPEFAESLRAYDADLFVVVAYGEIVKQNLLDMPRLGAINIHASLLPKFRGAAPIQRCLMEGEQKTGITIIAMTAQMDAGDILKIEEIAIPPEMTFGELEPQLCALGEKLILEVIAQFQTGKVCKTPQDHSRATLAPKLTAAEEVIDWSRPAQALHNQIRALSPFPGAWASVQIGNENKRLKIKKSFPVDAPSRAPGTILSLGKEGWIVACGQGALRLLEVQLEGKKNMPADDFIKGVRTPISFIIN